MFLLQDLWLRRPQDHRRGDLRQLAEPVPGGRQGRRDVQPGHQGVEAGAQPSQIRHSSRKLSQYFSLICKCFSVSLTGPARGRRGLRHRQGGDVRRGRQAGPRPFHGQDQAAVRGQAGHRGLPQEAAGWLTKLSSFWWILRL